MSSCLTHYSHLVPGGKLSSHTTLAGKWVGIPLIVVKERTATVAHNGISAKKITGFRFYCLRRFRNVLVNSSLKAKELI